MMTASAQSLSAVNPEIYHAEYSMRSTIDCCAVSMLRIDDLKNELYARVLRISKDSMRQRYVETENLFFHLVQKKASLSEFTAIRHVYSADFSLTPQSRAE
jgi:hypothetical protein